MLTGIKSKQMPTWWVSGQGLKMSNAFDKDVRQLQNKQTSKID